MRAKTILSLLLSTLWLTMCTSFSEKELANPIEGLSCRGSTDTAQGLECKYTCPDGTVKSLEFESDPSLSATKGDLDRQFCGIAPPATPTKPPASASPTLSVSPTQTKQASPTATVVTVATQDPLLTGTVSMCDLGGKLINFRVVQPAPDLTERTLDVQIAEQDSTCYTNPTNPALLTCTIPAEVSFPASVVVSLDGAVVNEFVYSGLGCTVLTTPTPAPKPQSYP